MPEFVIDVSDVAAFASDFPDGPVEAEIKKAELKIAQSSGNPMIDLTLEIYHPQFGTAKLFDNLPHAFPRKVKAFWMALNELTEEEVQANPKFAIDVDSLVGAQLIVNLGTEEHYNQPGRMVKKVVNPFYFPITRRDVLSYE